VLLPLLAGSAHAFPCDRLGLSCSLVMASPLGDDDKLQVVASMIDNAQNWNTDFTASEPPEGTAVVNNDLVSDAWIRIMAVQPSAYEDGRLLSPGYGEVVAKGNYEITTPYGSEYDDCDTQYHLDHQSKIVQYLNGKEIGVGETASFHTTTEVLNFGADLVIDAELSVDHYQWTLINDTEECVYDYTEQRNAQTVASDTLQVVRYQPNITNSFTVENKYYGITQIHFNASNYSWFRLQFNNKDYYEERLTEFDRFFTLEPYYILNFKPYAHKTVKYEGIRYYNNTFQVTNTDGCEILLGDYFRTYTIPCPLDYTPNHLEITTDKTVYFPGEPIHVTITSSVPAEVSYGNTTLLTQQSAGFIANIHENLITGNANGVQTFHAIHVTNPTIWITIIELLVFLLVAYIFWKIMTKIFGSLL